ncbi:MAG: PDZ domain-containing protein, partial [Candidatus Nealsonbacteria bacterium]|nr:PDZ domain-containing protein [Candidatus Nealsonbacteria bacterium]
VIAIGNALGEFRNTVSSGVISGLSRTINASGGSSSETLEDVIQIDAAINPGNSGGPLINLNGEVIGINTAMVQQAQSIGFTIPINKAKRDVMQVRATGKISYPFLGVRYILINDAVKEKYKLSVDNGAYVQKGDNGEPAVSKGSAADKAGFKEGDIITEINGQKITQDTSLSEIISKFSPGDKITLKYLRDNKEATVETTLGERNE